MNQVFVLDVGPNKGDLGPVVPVGQVAAENRQVDLGAGAVAGDKVLLLGASDPAGPFHPVPILPPNGPNPRLELSVPRSTVLFTSRFTHYRTQRLEKATTGSSLDKVRLTADLPSSAPGSTMFRSVQLDYTEFLGLAAGVKTFSKTVVPAADIPGGAVVLRLIGDSAHFIPFDDGAAPAVNADYGNTTFPKGLLDTYQIGTGSLGDIQTYLGTIMLGNEELATTEDLVLTVTCANDLKDFTQGHLKLTLVISAPVPF